MALPNIGCTPRGQILRQKVEAAVLRNDKSLLPKTWERYSKPRLLEKILYAKDLELRLCGRNLGFSKSDAEKFVGVEEVEPLSFDEFLAGFWEPTSNQKDKIEKALDVLIKAKGGRRQGIRVSDLSRWGARYIITSLLSLDYHKDERTPEEFVTVAWLILAKETDDMLRNNENLKEPNKWFLNLADFSEGE
jgi:hypothetical protein